MISTTPSRARMRASVAGNRSLVPVFMDTGATLVDKSNMASFAASPPAAR